MDDYFEMLKKNPMVQDALRREYMDPTSFLPEETRKEIKVAVNELSCKICKLSTRALVEIIGASRPNRKGFNDEDFITWKSESLCSVYHSVNEDNEFERKMADIAPSPPMPAPWMDFFDTRQNEKGEWELHILDKPVAKRGREVDKETARAGHVLRQVCEEKIASNADLVAQKIYQINKESCLHEECTTLELIDKVAIEICTDTKGAKCFADPSDGKGTKARHDEL
mmetsp:Transcript_1367/g.1938  ORF Transcript_1367/g.1938 Transcript_1367/m.1938 type:complete len:226 (+) Transcript_1367:292-969(+)